jgi:hypothetical protein
MSTKKIVVPARTVKEVDGNTFFEFNVWFDLKSYDVNLELIKNKKPVLELLATAVFHPDSVKAKKFKQKKVELVEMITPHIIFLEKENPDDWECVGGVKKTTFKLPPGRYYIGDLCYAMKDEVYQDIWCSKFRNEDGVYKNTHGAHFAMRGTSWDGDFQSDSKTYTVDAGHIGIAHESLCTPGAAEDDMWVFEKEVECTFNGKTYDFGHEGPYITKKVDYSDDE